MRALGKGVRKNPARDHAALVGRVEQNLCTDLIGDLADLGHRVGKQVQAAADRNDLWANGMGKVVKCRQIKGIAVRINRGRVGCQAVKARTARCVMRDMAADAAGRRYDAVAGFRQRHKAVEVGQGPRTDPDFGVSGVKDFCGQFGGDDLDFLNRLQPHFILVAGVTKGRARPEATRKGGFGAGVHHVGRGVEVEAVPVVDFLIAVNELVNPRGHGGTGFPGICSKVLDQGFAMGRNPGAGGKMGHGDLLLCEISQRETCKQISSAKN